MIQQLVLWRIGKILAWCGLGAMIVAAGCQQQQTGTLLILTHGTGGAITSGGVQAGAQAGARPTTVAVPSVSSGGGSSVIVVPTPIVSIPAPVSSSLIEQVIAEAMTWLGVRYNWGGCSRSTGIDCSCFVQTAWAVVGVHLPRVTTAQIQFARPISAAQAAVGDLVFFDNTCSDCGANPTHVGLVLGPGRMIDAGDPVQIEPIFSGHNARYGRVY